MPSGASLRCAEEAADAFVMGRTLDRGRTIGAPALLEAVPECVLVVGSDGRIERANRRTMQLTGFGSLEGRPLETLIPGGFERVVAEQPLEALCRRADGSEVPVEVKAGWLDEPERLLVVTLHDVTALRAGIEATIRTEGKFRAVVEQISAITYTWSWRDGDYVVVYASPQIEDILGYTPEEWAAAPTAWYDWVHPEDRAAVIEENKRCEQTAEAFAMQYRMTRKDGGTIWVEDSWVVVEDEHAAGRAFQGVVFDITERKLAEREIAFLAHHDKLTGLPNRAFFEETLELAISRARRHGHGIAVLDLDLDNFKLVNDSLGHRAGDQLLVQLAERLRETTRDTDLVARQGGDEFLMLLSDLEGGPALHDESDGARIVAESVARRIQRTLQEPFVLDGTAIRASGSIGVALFPQDGVDPETLLRNADTAMYEAKRFTRGGHVLYAAGGEAPLEKLSLSTKLRHAVEEQQWLLHYQPIVDLEDGRMMGVEALIRWQEADGTMVPPGDFIPLAEELGLIEQIGDWVIGEMARQQRLWRDLGLDVEMSFNLSPRQLWSDRLAERLLSRLRIAGADPRTIVVEVTESTAMADPDRTQRVLEELRGSGLAIALDDFGTGYSSLSRLKEMPVDILKIDRAFVRDVDTDPGLAGMVRAMIELAQSLNMVPLAEGVETAGEYEFLRASGMRLAQGFFFARPSPAEAIPALAAREDGLAAGAAQAG
jgi:diguanylate cyclase (GGDEF)-like protein/PAS domain S-box-containing protein